MIAPPPIPNKPARMPVTTPPAMIAAANNASSDHGMPASTSGRDGSGFCAHIRHESGRVAQDFGARLRLHRMGCDVTAKGACAGDALEQPEHMTRHRVQP